MTITTTDQIWRDFNKELLKFILNRVKDRDIAKDLLQDIFVKIHLKLDTLNDNEKLSSWVYQITRNSILDHYKKSKKSGSLESDIPMMEESYSDSGDFQSCIRPFLSGLPESYREAILQTELGNFSQKEYAEKQNISYSGAKSRIQRGRKLLLDVFNSCCHITADKYGNVLEYERKKNCLKC